MAKNYQKTPKMPEAKIVTNSNTQVNTSTLPKRTISIAPMLDWTDRHCRYFHRLMTRQTLLYTEMVTTGALLHGNVPRHLDFDASEHPVALQLGGSEPEDLAFAAKLGQEWGYDEINLNCGCPSERVQRGAFGACLMAEPALVADGVQFAVQGIARLIDDPSERESKRYSLQLLDRDQAMERDDDIAMRKLFGKDGSGETTTTTDATATTVE